MNEDEFVAFCESITEADGCKNGAAMTFFRAIVNGYKGPRYAGPPIDDLNAVDGYDIGVEIAKNLK